MDPRINCSISSTGNRYLTEELGKLDLIMLPYEDNKRNI
jgi:hypothetical protein